MSTTTSHPLIAAAEDALRAEGDRQAKRIEKRLRELLRILARRFGPLSISMGMGSWSIEGGKMTVRHSDDSEGELDLDELKWWADEPKRTGWRSLKLDDEAKAALMELFQLCEWLIDAHYLPNVSVGPVTP